MNPADYDGRGGRLPLLRLYGRTYCHLCDDMIVAVKSLQAEFEFDLEVFDVDTDPTLEAKYDELVPVLMVEGRELCHYHLDERAVRAYLADFR